MAEFIKGEVVVVPFPFSDLTEAKRRPALVLCKSGRGEYILCQITSKDVMDEYAINLEQTDFENGGLSRSSNIRPNKIFTADKSIILYSAGRATKAKLEQTTKRIIEILKS